MGQHRPTEHMEQLLQRLQVAFAALAVLTRATHGPAEEAPPVDT